MRRDFSNVMAAGRTALALLAGATLAATAAAAQAGSAGAGSWRIGASTGGFAPRSALIAAADGNSTRLGAGPLFTLEVQYLASAAISVYGSGGMAFSTITLGSSIQPAVAGPSNQVLLGAATAGLQLTPPGAGWLGGSLKPTLRLGGGLKWYHFDLTGAESQWRPTADIGVGLRGFGGGPIEVTAEVRYLPSSFDQAKLPIRGIVPQDQRQSDLVFGIGIAVRR